MLFVDKHDTVVFATVNRATLCGTIWIIAPHNVARNHNNLARLNFSWHVSGMASNFSLDTQPQALHRKTLLREYVRKNIKLLIGMQ